MKNGKPPTLDERIAMTIGATDPHAAAVLADLIRETDEQIDHCDQLGRLMRARSVDPTILDPAARGAAEDSEFRAARLRNGLARLRELEHEALARERLHQWHAEALNTSARTCTPGSRTPLPAICRFVSSPR
jgi:hypothetical protein